MAQTVIYRLSLAEGIVCNAAYLEKPQTPCSVHWHCKIESAGLRSKQWHILLPRSTNWSFLSLKALWLLPQTCWCLYACLYVCVIVPHLRRLFWGSSITLQRSIFLPNLIAFLRYINSQYIPFFCPRWKLFYIWGLLLINQASVIFYFILTPLDGLNAISSKCSGNCFLSV